MSNELFEQWALDPKGYNWTSNPNDNPKKSERSFTAQDVWCRQSEAFNAGVEAERQRLKKLVEARMRTHYYTLDPAAYHMLRTVLNWLSDPQPATDVPDKNVGDIPEPDKTQTND